jgi:hypothetical protein
MADTLTIERAAVESSTLAGIGYDERRRILSVGFKSGAIFHYANVDVGTWERFRDAASKGSFYAHHIKGRYPAQKMTGPCPKCGDQGVIGLRCTDCGTAEYQAQALPPAAVLRPTRVIVGADGVACSHERAQRLGIEHDVVFVRDDGWTLGAPLKWMDVARHMWRAHWTQQWVKNVATGQWTLRWPLPGDGNG